MNHSLKKQYYRPNNENPPNPKEKLELLERPLERDDLDEKEKPPPKKLRNLGRGALGSLQPNFVT